MLVDVAPGELIDKITILAIKSERMDDETKLVNVRHELDILTTTRDKDIQTSPELDALSAKLKAVNEALWEIEDDIRDCEAAKDYSQKFIDLARAVYVTNDERANLKREINLLLGSDIVEEKSYKPY
ncbi:MAG: hypothetical protein HN731_14050 [Rhodospirillaceae bacterium]|nr:hypothetical protein [Rhodospirillaceae bacterium]MBT7956310.1 hypothetical protein [Rhodospirillaceae bacterium]